MIKSTIDRDADLTVHLCLGKITADEIASVVGSFYSSIPTKNIVWDLTDADTSDFSNPRIHELALKVKKIAHSRHGGKTALVASMDLAFGLSRVYEAFAEGARQIAEIRVFRTLEEAKEWIAG